jgi:hypothetical protein
MGELERRDIRTWNDDRRLVLVYPIVRREIARILDWDVFGCGEMRRRGDRLNDPGCVQALLDVGLRRKARCGPGPGR